MCGITGVISLKDKKVDEAIIRRMTDCIIHRGPNDGGTWAEGPVGLGNRRLSIIDLSPLGHMPMTSLDGRIVMTYNGEVYNFQEKRAVLEKKGYKFRSHTDTEVIINLYLEYGEDFLQHLRGMFALALWDKKLKKLIVARDRLGKKPIKYFQNKDTLVFGSEIKSLLLHPEVPRQPDLQAIDMYLALRYVPTPLTGFKNIKKLPAGHYLTVENGQVKVKKYWQVNFRHKLDLSESEWAELVLEKFDESVRLRMIADVPIGAFLSGGLDSSMLVALMSRHSAKPVKTFTVGFDDQEVSEIKFAARIAKRFKTDHIEIHVKPNVIKDLPEIVRTYEEPFADPAALPTYLMSKVTAKHVTVVLNGDGGDENFGGYPKHQIARQLSSLDQIPASARKFAAASATFGSKVNPKFKKTAFLLESVSEGLGHAYLTKMGLLDRRLASRLYIDKEALYTDHFKDSVDLYQADRFLGDILEASRGLDPVDRALYIDFATYLPDDLLPKVDLGSMAHSLEARSPLLDHELIELTAQMPSSLKVKDGGKYIWKKIARQVLPADIIDRPKQGFSVPLPQWFAGPLKNYLSDILLSRHSVSRNLFRPDILSQMIDDQVSGRHPHYDNHLWALLTLELWFQQYID